MPSDRRRFLGFAAGSVASLMLAGRARAATTPKVIAFDAFTVFDPRPIGVLADQLFPGKGAELASLWRTRQFEYAWLRTVGRRYQDFWSVSEDALGFAAAQLKLDLTDDKKARLLRSFLELKTYPDSAAALKRLRAAGIRLCFLSNFTEKMLEASVTSAGLTGLFDQLLSTDRVRAFKPDARAYQMAVDAFSVRRDDIVFAAFGGWDAAGAKWFGYRTFWVNRLQQAREELSVAPDGTGATLHDLAAFVHA